MTRLGEAIPRIEDARLLRGQGAYLDDTTLGTGLYAAIVRSPHAHADIASIDATAALALPGVVYVITAAELSSLGIGPIFPNAQVNPHTGQRFEFEPMPVLAAQRVRYVGEPVAVVVAERRDQAADALDAVEIDYRTLAAVASVNEADADTAPALFDSVDRNTCLDWQHGDSAAVERVFADAAHVVDVQLHNHRIIAQPMEPRGALASFDEKSGEYLLTLASQNVHSMRDHVAVSLNAATKPAHRGPIDAVLAPPQRTDGTTIRVQARDVGGGFGSRNFVYPEYVLMLVAARRCARPVRWVSTRSEGCISDHQARDVALTAHLALSAEGDFLALKTAAVFAAGAYMTGVACGVPTGQYVSAPSSVYAIPSVAQTIKVVLTNTTPIGVTRGPGFAETVDPLERLIDKAARTLGFDRFELRRRNMVRTEQMPWTNTAGVTFDSGDFPGCLERALVVADYAGVADRIAQSAKHSKLRGFGLACHVKGTGGSPEENISFGFEHGRLVFTTGTQAIGQGHETSFRQICQHLLGVPLEQIEYRAGDTALIPIGGGHGSSRATYMASTAMSYAAQALIAKGRHAAAMEFAVSRDQIEFRDGSFFVIGTNRSRTLLDIASAAAAAGRPLDTYQHTVRDAMTWPNGCHAAEIEVCTDTGLVSLQRYTAVDDHGVLINPMLVQGQSHGAIMQGVAQALLEQVHYDASSAQPATGSLLDYAMPRASDLPMFAVEFQSTRCRGNPLGVKGAGESGAIAGYPAVANAIADALGVAPDAWTGIASAERIWRLLQTRASLGR